MEIVRLHHSQLEIEEFSIKSGESWCLYGENNSGIDFFLQLLEGGLSDYSAEVLDLPESYKTLSFNMQQKLYEEELRNDDTNFLDRIDPGTLVREFLPEWRSQLGLLESLGMEGCLDRGYRQLSSGQSRKLLLLQELASTPNLLILQNPFDGLDEKSCCELNIALSKVSKQGTSVLLLVNVRADIPKWCTHLAVFKGKIITEAGERSDVLKTLIVTDTNNNDSLTPETPDSPKIERNRELLAVENCFAGYGDTLLFTDLNLSIYDGDHTLICGPNGCGKSTLLDIITGDNPKCYANKMRLFGHPRGSGESIWDIKKRMGIVSPNLHSRHRNVGTALHVVLSGLHDSIGLYKKVHDPEIKSARRWLDWLNLENHAATPFSRLSYAEQRLVLVARALVKLPDLLILDEPTQGLDDSNREKILYFLSKVASDKLSTIIYVSHRKDEHRPFFKQQIMLDSYTP
jgi:molybdate transport system ATP-binding protein